jgi:hypothetical protein
MEHGGIIVTGALISYGNMGVAAVMTMRSKQS